MTRPLYELNADEADLSGMEPDVAQQVLRLTQMAATLEREYGCSGGATSIDFTRWAGVCKPKPPGKPWRLLAGSAGPRGVELRVVYDYRSKRAILAALQAWEEDADLVGDPEGWIWREPVS